MSERNLAGQANELRTIAEKLLKDDPNDFSNVKALTDIRGLLADLDFLRLFRHMDSGDRKELEVLGVLYVTRKIIDDLYQTFAMDSPITFMDHRGFFSRFACQLGQFLLDETATQGDGCSTPSLYLAIHDFYAAIHHMENELVGSKENVPHLISKEEVG